MSVPARDLAIVVVLAIAAAGVSWINSGRVGSALDVRGASPGGHDDIWFDADVRDLHRRFTFDNYQQNHTARHPLVALAARVPLRLYLKAVPGAHPVDAVRGGLALIAAVWLVMLFGTLRVIGSPRVDAVLFTSIGLASAANLFWFTVPETFALGALSILPTVAVVGIAGRQGVSEWIVTVSAALSAAISATNAMFGVFAVWLVAPRRRVIQILANAACVVLVLWGVQRFIYPSSGFPHVYDRSYRGFFLSDDMRTPLGPLATFLSHGVVMPRVDAINRMSQENYPVLSVQRSVPGTSSFAGGVAVACWLVLLGTGLWAAWVQRQSALPAFLLLSIGGQLALHLVFGEETFLFAMHYVPLLIVAAAFSCVVAPQAGVQGRLHLRPFVRATGLLLLCSLAANNLSQLSTAIEVAREITARLAS